MPARVWLKQIMHDRNPAAALPDLPKPLAEAWQVAARYCDLQDAEFARVVADHFSLPHCNFHQATDLVSRYTPQKLATEKLIAPIRLQDDALVVATANPNDADALSQARFASGKRLIVEVASPEEIEAHLSHLYTSDVGPDLNSHIRLREDGEPQSNSETQRHPIVKLARQMLFKAYRIKSSDIHVQPIAGGGQIRFRVDGVLRRSATMPTNVLERLVRYFMNMTGMDPSRATIPQDGSGTLWVGQHRVDLRVSVLPNREGQRLVIRLLDQSSVFNLASMNLPPAELKVLRRLTSFSQGMILLTGPTGSGKTTTLYGLLSSLNNDESNIITLENPVEYQLEGISQVDIDDARGLTFAAALRSILRQDPDVLLVGEVRDEETATIATRAALTGHLLLSTLHTMDARNAIARLVDLGISQPILGETLLGIVAQRLVRKLCDACAAPVVEPLSDIEALFAKINNGRPPARRAVGCEACGFTGYKGRTPVLEIIEVTPGVRSMLMNNSFSLEELDSRLVSTYQSLGLRARGQIQAGQTTVNEAHRVLGLKFWADIAQDENKNIYEFLSGDMGDEGVARANLMLISEDDGMVRRLSEGLSDSYNLVSFGTIEAALKHLHTDRNTDVLVLDVEREGSDVREFLLDLRSAFDWSGLPAIIIVPDNHREVEELLQAHSANYVLTKPVSIEQLIGQIQAMSQR